MSRTIIVKGKHRCRQQLHSSDAYWIDLLSLGFANTNETQSFLNESINIFMMARSDVSVDANSSEPKDVFSFQNGQAPAANLVMIQDQLKDVRPAR